MMKKPRNVFVLSILGIWAIACLAIVSQLHSFHYLSFWPDANLAVKRDQQWSLTHVLGVDCKCSSVVGEYLIKRGPQANTFENVLILGKDSSLAKRFSEVGYQVQEKDPNELSATEHALGVPFVIINSPKGPSVYAGGYGDRKVVDGGPIRDLEILEALKGGRTSASFPIFGCVASLKYQKLTDPFAMKYTTTELKK